MHPADIKAALAKSGRTQASVAKELQVTPVTVHQVIFGSVHSRRPAPAPDSLTEALV